MIAIGLRVGVVSEHWGNRLQLRLMRALEARARLNGWCSIVSDTTDNRSSANNFIRARYHLFEPTSPEPGGIRFWRKVIKIVRGPFCALSSCSICPVASWLPGFVVLGVSWK